MGFYTCMEERHGGFLVKFPSWPVVLLCSNCSHHDKPVTSVAQPKTGPHYGNIRIVFCITVSNLLSKNQLHWIYNRIWIWILTEPLQFVVYYSESFLNIHRFVDFVWICALEGKIHDDLSRATF